MNSLLMMLWRPISNAGKAIGNALGIRSTTVQDVRQQDGSTRALDQADEMLTDPIAYVKNLVEGLVYPKERDAAALLAHKEVLKRLMTDQIVLRQNLVWNRQWPTFENFGPLGFFCPHLIPDGYMAYGGDGLGINEFCRQPMQDVGLGRQLMTRQTSIFFTFGKIGGTADRSGNIRTANAALDNAVIVSVHMTNPFFAVNGWLKEVDSRLNRVLDVIRNVEYYDFGEDGQYGAGLIWREGFNIGHIGGDMINAVLRIMGVAEVPRAFLQGELVGTTSTSSWDEPVQPATNEQGWRHFILWPGGLSRPLPFRGYRYHPGYGYPHVGDSAVERTRNLFPRAVYRDDLTGNRNFFTLRTQSPMGIWVIRIDCRDTEAVPAFTPLVT